MEKAVNYDYFQTENEPDEYIDFGGFFRDWIRMIFDYWWLLLAIVSLSSSLGICFEKLTYKPRYETSASFIVDISSAISYDNSSKYQNTMEQISKTFPKLVKTSAFEKMLLAEMNIDKFPDDLFIYVSALSDTSLITIYIYSDSPKLAYDTLQAVLKCYPKISGYVLGNIDMKMISNAGRPKKPLKELKLRERAAYASIIGLIVCLVVTGILVSMKKTVRKEEDIHNIFNIQCFGSIPWIRKKNAKNHEGQILLFNRRGVGYEFNEALRMVRARVERDHVESNAKIYLISSAIPGEGKTTVSVNLALALAESGKKVMLIDLDVRNPSVMRILGRDTIKINYHDIFERNNSLEEILIKDIHPNLLVLAVDKTNKKPAEVINHPGMHSLFEEAKKMADYILVDTAPSSLLSDAASIVEYADAGIYVVCQDYAPIERIKDGVEMLTGGGLRISGFILNMTDTSVVGYSHKHNSYQYGYYNRKVE